ncbi:MAG TPA: NAD(P)/FAD-dependent oxidoreductase, partial [Waddliaceae bacterium]
MDNQFDVVVIGSGPGGYVAAIRAAQLGFKVACVEKRNTLGGTCLNVGCIPSKALLQSSECFAFAKKGAEEQGVSYKNVSFDFAKMMGRKEKIVDGSVKGIDGLFKKNGITTVCGKARFISLDHLEISYDKKTTLLKAKSFVIATGSQPIPLPFLPFDENFVLSSTGALSLSKIPKKMVVIGAGVIGVEIASIYNRLGTEIIIVEMLDRICPAMDNALGKALFQSLKKQGLVFHLSSRVTDAEVNKHKVILKVETQNETLNLEGNALLVAIGRFPYSEGLGLEKIGVEKSAKGFVLVDSQFRTSLPHIFAIGD